MKESINITTDWKPIPIHYYSHYYNLLTLGDLKDALCHSNTWYRSVLCIIITLAYSLYYFWLLIKINKKIRVTSCGLKTKKKNKEQKEDWLVSGTYLKFPVICLYITLLCCFSYPTTYNLPEKNNFLTVHNFSHFMEPAVYFQGSATGPEFEQSELTPSLLFI